MTVRAKFLEKKVCEGVWNTPSHTFFSDFFLPG